jgi:hypothetical protein
MVAVSRRDLIGAASGLVAGVGLLEATRHFGADAASQSTAATKRTTESNSERIEQYLLRSIPDAKNNEMHLSTFTVHCMKGEFEGSSIAFCSDPAQDRDIVRPALGP